MRETSICQNFGDAVRGYANITPAEGWRELCTPTLLYKSAPILYRFSTIKEVKNVYTFRMLRPGKWEGAYHTPFQGDTQHHDEYEPA